MRDILDSGEAWIDKSYTLDSNYYKTLGQTGFDKQSGQRKMVAEPVGVTSDVKSYALTATYCKGQPVNKILDKSQRSRVAEPVCLRYERTDEGKSVRSDYESGKLKHGYNEMRNLQPRTDGKTNTVTTVQTDNMIAEPIRIGNLDSTAQAHRIYSIDGKSVTLKGNAGGQGGKTGLYAIPVEFENSIPTKAVSCADGKTYPVYEVKDGLITIKEKTYPIKLADGYYIIRKFTVVECRRLQTVPDWYIMPCSATQNYKMLGNGWTVEVISYLLSHIPDIKSEPVEVLSMYDGMSCGHIVLDILGVNVVNYYASEIDKYCIRTTLENYPETDMLGDAFGVRTDNWTNILDDKIKKEAV